MGEERRESGKAVSAAKARQGRALEVRGCVVDGGIDPTHYLGRVRLLAELVATLDLHEHALRLTGLERLQHGALVLECGNNEEGREGRVWAKAWAERLGVGGRIGWTVCALTLPASKSMPALVERYFLMAARLDPPRSLSCRDGRGSGRGRYG